MSAQVTREVTILSILGNSEDRSQPFTRIYIEPVDWDGSSCQPSGADLLKHDNHMLSLLFVAWISGKSVELTIETTKQPFDAACQVYQVRAT